MSDARLVVFAYNFPHKKTQDVLLRLSSKGGRSKLSLRRPPRSSILPPLLSERGSGMALSCTREFSRSGWGAKYYVSPHNSRGTISILEELGADLGLIAGARILKKAVILRCGKGIINLHPGLIPEARGLDALSWSIYGDIPLGVTAPLIDEHGDAGVILLRKQIPIYADDTVWDLSERLHETLLDMITPALEAALRSEGAPVDPTTAYNRKMPADLEKTVWSKVPDYVARFASIEAREAGTR